MPIIERWKPVILTDKFFRKSVMLTTTYGRKTSLFPSPKIALEMTLRAIRYRKYGFFITDYRPKKASKWLCIFKCYRKSFVTVPIIEKHNCYIVPTIFPSSKWQIKIYKKFNY